VRRALDFLWLIIRCCLFIWAVSTILILILFAIGSEADGLTLAERIWTAVRYAAYVGGLFGSLLAIYIWWQNWKITRKNKKTRARKEKRTS